MNSRRPNQHTYFPQSRDEWTEISPARLVLPTCIILTLEATQSPPEFPETKSKDLSKQEENLKSYLKEKNGKENPAVLTFIGGLENSSSMIFNKPLSATKSNQFKLNKFFLV